MLLAAIMIVGLQPVTAGATEPHTHNDITFEPWTDGTQLPTEAGSWYLDTDVTLDATWNVPAGTAETPAVTNLCLNGHTIHADCTENSFSVITVPANAALNLYDCNGTNTTHYYTYNGNEAAWTLLDGVPQTSVPLADFDSTKNEIGTVVSLTGGCITGGTGYKYSAASTDSVGGGIYGNTAQFWCADCAVRIFVRLSKNLREYFVYFRGFLGDMTEYDASKMRAVICAVLPYVKGGSLTMYSGNICDNSALHFGGGVYM